MRSTGSFISGLASSGRVAERFDAPALSVSNPSTISPFLFESLFDRALRPEGGFLQNLKSAGYDPEARRGSYDPRVLTACLLVANDYCYPHLGSDAAALRLGRRCMAELIESRRSWFASISLPLFGVEMQLKRVVALIHREALLLPIELKRVCSGYWRIEVHQEINVIPEFLGGMIEEGLRSTGADVRVGIDRRAEGFAIAVRW